MPEFLGKHTEVAFPATLEVAGTVYEDREPGLPWQSKDPQTIGIAAWPGIDYSNSAVVLLVERDATSGHSIRVAQRWDKRP